MGFYHLLKRIGGLAIRMAQKKGTPEKMSNQRARRYFRGRHRGENKKRKDKSNLILIIKPHRNPSVRIAQLSSWRDRADSKKARHNRERKKRGKGPYGKAPPYHGGHQEPKFNRKERDQFYQIIHPRIEGPTGDTREMKTVPSFRKDYQDQVSLS